MMLGVMNLNKTLSLCRMSTKIRYYTLEPRNTVNPEVQKML